MEFIKLMKAEGRLAESVTRPTEKNPESRPYWFIRDVTQDECEQWQKFDGLTWVTESGEHRLCQVRYTGQPLNERMPHKVASHNLVHIWVSRDVDLADLI
jgi:hypothetical protein